MDDGDGGERGKRMRPSAGAGACRSRHAKTKKNAYQARITTLYTLPEGRRKKKKANDKRHPRQKLIMLMLMLIMLCTVPCEIATFTFRIHGGAEDRR
eukprot:scaffold124228_cov26-Tisochrysis_lutea.AAC.1